MKIYTIFKHFFSFYRSWDIMQVVLQMEGMDNLAGYVVFYFILIGKKIHKKQG